MGFLRQLDDAGATLASLRTLLGTVSHILREGDKIHITCSVAEWDAMIAACKQGGDQ